MNITYVGNYVGKVALNLDGLEFIKDARWALKGSGFIFFVVVVILTASSSLTPSPATSLNLS